MIKHSILRITLFLSSIFIVISCGDPASVEEVNGPQNIRPQITLTKTINNATGQAENLIKTIFRNTDDEIIEIESGRVSVNGTTMDPPVYYVFGEQRNYYRKVLPLTADSIYVFEIEFSDGSTTYAWIESPEVDLFQIDMPIEHRRNADLKVKWLDTDFRYPQKCVIQYWDKEDGFSDSNQKRLVIHDPYRGEYLISGKYLGYRDINKEVNNETRVILISETEGMLESQFLSGGYIRCYFKLYQDVYIY